jgi:uncharacterized protein
MDLATASRSPHPAGTGRPDPSRRRAAAALGAFAALTLLPVLGLAALAFAGAIDGATIQALTPAAMLLPALVAVSVWSLTRPAPLGVLLRVRPERGWRRAVGWSVLALVAVVALGAAAAGSAALLGVAEVGTAWRAVLPALPVTFVTMLAFALAEEVGWRGFAQHLLAPIGPVRASLAIAAFWSLWHAPAMAVWVWEGTMPLAAALTTLGSLVLGGAVLSALALLGGSVWPAVVGHAAMNSAVVYLTSTVVTGDPAAIGSAGLVPWALAGAGLLALVAASSRSVAGPAQASRR